MRGKIERSKGMRFIATRKVCFSDTEKLVFTDTEKIVFTDTEKIVFKDTEKIVFTDKEKIVFTDTEEMCSRTQKNCVHGHRKKYIFKELSSILQAYHGRWEISFLGKIVTCAALRWLCAADGWCSHRNLNEKN